MKRKVIYLLFIILYLFLSVPGFSQSEFSLRVAPGLQMPIGLDQFDNGYGAYGSLDWSFVRIFRQFDIGISLGGSIFSMPVVNNTQVIGEPLGIMEGTGGIFIRWRPLDRLAFRIAGNTGVYQWTREDDTSSNMLYSGGIGAEFFLSPYFSLFADGSYTHRIFDTDPLTSMGVSVGVKINLSEIMGGYSRIRVDKTEQHRVFPVSWAWYEKNPVATIKVTNEEPNSITNVNLSFFMDSYMSEPWTFAVIPSIRPGQSIDVPVTALFNEAMLSLTENVNANGILQINYLSLGARKETDSTIQMPIYHRNTLSWDDDRRAAAFVSPRDSAARLFARSVAGALETSDRLEQLSHTPRNVLYAAAMFEALRLYGISYVIVPATSFVNVKADESVLDNVSYPYQALYYRGGDCSYLSILFCSLLEALDIETAFITIPGHIYIAFEVGDDFWYSYNADIIETEIDGVKKRWLPVEITIPTEGFTRAWRVGARQWRNAGAEAAIYPIRECWEIYPSVTVPASSDHLPQMPAWNSIVSAMEREAGLFRWSDAARAAAERERARLQAQ